MIKKACGVLLVQLGTPDSPSPKAVKRYLAEFLDDKAVVDLPYVLRKLLLHGVILRTRPKQSAKAYAAIWDKNRGSPLRFHTEDAVEQLQTLLGEHTVVRYAMRYGGPSIQATLNQLRQETERVVILPLFPQYASATTGSVMTAISEAVSSQPSNGKIDVIKQFYDDPHFIRAFSNRIQSEMAKGQWDQILMSFHSLPVRQIQKTNSQCQAACFNAAPCPPLNADNAVCYRAQCYETARQLAQACGLKQQDYKVIFQSRLGRIPWIGPELNQVLSDLRQQGVRRLLVACPSFVTDCLETLEEVGIRANETWQHIGGEKLTLVPCLNADPDWVEGLSGILNEVLI